MENSVADVEAKAAAEIAKDSAEISAQAAKVAAEAGVEATKQDIQEKVADFTVQAQSKAKQAGQNLSDLYDAVKDNIKEGASNSLSDISAKTARLADKIKGN